MNEFDSKSFVTTIDLHLAEKLKKDLIDQGFELTKPAYTVFQAKKKRYFFNFVRIRKTHGARQRKT